MKMSKHGSLYLVVAWFLFHSMALAQGPIGATSAEAEAKAGGHFQRGVELFKEEAYRAALVEFQRAYALAPDYRLLYNIGRVQVKVQDYLGAAQSYERYLNEGGGAIEDERRAHVEAALAELRGRVGRISLTVDRDGADVLLDDVKIGITPITSPIPTNLGRHHLRVRAPDGASDTQVVDVAAGDIATVEMKLAGRSASSQASTARPWSTYRKATVVTAVAGGLLLVGGAVTGILAWRANSDLERLLDLRGGDRRELADQRSALRIRSLTTDVLLGTGAVTAVTAAVLWLVGSEHRETPSKQRAARTRLGVDVGVGRLGVSGTF